MNQTIELRPPQPEDGSAVFELVEQCAPLDPNSMYCNLLQCSHLSDTSVAAVMDDELVSFTSGYLLPRRNDTLFLWQIAVGEKARGKGLATRMVMDILSRPQCRDVRYIETSITRNNEASWALFRKIARLLDAAEFNTSVMFDRNTHFADQHDSEILVRIGPFTPHHNLSA